MSSKSVAQRSDPKTHARTTRKKLRLGVALGLWRRVIGLQHLRRQIVQAQAVRQVAVGTYGVYQASAETGGGHKRRGPW